MMPHSHKQNCDLSNADDLQAVMDILASESLSELPESDLDEDENDPDYQPTYIEDAELKFSGNNDNSTGKY